VKIPAARQTCLEFGNENLDGGTVRGRHSSTMMAEAIDRAVAVLDLGAPSLGGHNAGLQ
jgi:hypothetical protein